MRKETKYNQETEQERDGASDLIVIHRMWG